MGKGLEINFSANLYGIISAGPGGNTICLELFLEPSITYIIYTIETIIYFGDSSHIPKFIILPLTFFIKVFIYKISKNSTKKSNKYRIKVYQMNYCVKLDSPFYFFKSALLHDSYNRKF